MKRTITLFKIFLTNQGRSLDATQRWHNISPIYQKTRNIGTFPLILIVLLLYRQKNGLILYRYRIRKKNEVFYRIFIV